MKSKVMTIANHLVKLGVERSAAMRRAWLTVKLRRIETKAVGVTFGKRQVLLERLTRYAADNITVQLKRDRLNLFDLNAVQIIAKVRGKGSAVIGYLNRELAAAIAPLLDKGKEVPSSFKGVTGGAAYNLTYGLNISLAV